MPVTPPTVRVTARQQQAHQRAEHRHGRTRRYVEPVREVEADHALGEGNAERARDEAADAGGEHAGGRRGQRRRSRSRAARRPRESRRRPPPPPARAAAGRRAPAGSPRARAPSGSKPTADQVAAQRQRRPPAASAATTAESTRSAVSRPSRVPNSSRSTAAPDSKTSLARITPVASAATSSSAVASPWSRVAARRRHRRALHAARVAERHGDAGERRADAGGVRRHEAREGRRAGRVREEGEPPQHDPGAEHAARDRQQHQLEQRLAQEGEIRQVERRGHRASLTRMILS